MLEQNLFFLKSMQHSEDQSFCQAVIELQPVHEIFRGHFPDNPVLPGVCMVQIIKELLCKSTGKDYILKNASHIKFQNPVNPLVNKILTISFSLKETNDAVEVNAQVTHDNITFASLKGIFTNKPKT